jgi:hypothetical protein
MFLLQIILIFVVIPAAMIIAGDVSGTTGAQVITYVLFPVGLLAFVLFRHLRGGASSDDEDPRP